MKIPYKHIIKYIEPKPSIKELSDNLFQLGHEHDIDGDIFEIELTPNRGDCLSLNGILRDLNLFHDVNLCSDIYDKEIPNLKIDFKNNASKSCPTISFLKIEVSDLPSLYNGDLKNYFDDLGVSKKNFFTDVSNYISYETGQPTHCYDASSISGELKLDFLSDTEEFETLLDKTIKLEPSDLVFLNHGKTINLAGVVGGKNSACSPNTKSVIIECAHFDPECIMGKSVKYDINSEAAHKFERFVDPKGHELALRRFIKVVEKHTCIKSIELFSKIYHEDKLTLIDFNPNKLNKILGTDIKDSNCRDFLEKLTFSIKGEQVVVPSYRIDVKTQNDLAEELARAIGYDNILKNKKNIKFGKKTKHDNIENKIKTLLIKHGFYEVINNPFVSEKINDGYMLDNPLDSNKKFIRKNLKNSLTDNLIYNERRQKETIKLFEISKIYDRKTNSNKLSIGIIASGRIGKNYIDFSQKINNKYIEEILKPFMPFHEFKFDDIPRSSIQSKSKNHISYLEFDINQSTIINYESKLSNKLNYQYVEISELPCSQRDLSFLIKDATKLVEIECCILNFTNKLLKEVFIFDFYEDPNTNELKVGFRFVFQSKKSTITDAEVNHVMNIIISECLKFDSVSIPGLK